MVDKRADCQPTRGRIPLLGAGPWKTCNPPSNGECATAPRKRARSTGPKRRPRRLEGHKCEAGKKNGTYGGSKAKSLPGFRFLPFIFNHGLRAPSTSASRAPPPPRLQAGAVSVSDVFGLITESALGHRNKAAIEHFFRFDCQYPKNCRL